MSRTIAIGDIHGCLIALETLLETIRLTPMDTLITLGDCVSKGPNSSGVLDVLSRIAQYCNYLPLLGNHDVLMLAALQNKISIKTWLGMGGDGVVDSYKNPDLDFIAKRHGSFLEAFLAYHEIETHVFVHACYDPNLPLDRQSEFTLFWDKLGDHLPGPHFSGKTVVVGHTPQKSGMPLITDHLLCIDTNCVKGGWLTAIEINTGVIWQASQKGRSRTWT